MRKFWLTSLLGACAMIATPAMIATSAVADDDLTKLAQNPKDWVMPTGDYANHRYSSTEADQQGECRQAPGGLDLLDGRFARP